MLSSGNRVANETAAPSRPRSSSWWKLWQPLHGIKALPAEPQEISGHFRLWQRRILLSTLIGYACFYLVRKNIGFALPQLQRDFGISKSDFGLFLTLHGVIYGVSKFLNGFVADRSNARVIMPLALTCSAMANLFFGWSAAVWVLGMIWAVNGWFQGMGFPPCARLMTHWFAPKILATKMCIWNTSHSIGTMVVAILCGYLAVWNWRLCFFVPAGLAFLGAIYLSLSLRDTPESVGLPQVEGTEQTHQSSAEFRAFLRKQVFRNRNIWLLGLANFFVYIVRYGILDWGPVLLSEAKGVRLTHAGWMLGAFEGCGMAGMLLGGWVTDKVFGGRGARTCVFSMILSGASLFAFWKIPGTYPVLSTAALCCGGFFIYAPQALVGILAANLATKRAAATGSGLTGLFGYLSTVLSGWGLGKVVDVAGWNTAFCALIAATFFGMLLFAAAWQAKPSGYLDK